MAVSLSWSPPGRRAAAPALRPFFIGNPAVNGVIVGILLAGIVYIFRQVMLLNPEVAWIENFRRNQAPVSTERSAAAAVADGDDAGRAGAAAACR